MEGRDKIEGAGVVRRYINIIVESQHLVHFKMGPCFAVHSLDDTALLSSKHILTTYQFRHQKPP